MILPGWVSDFFFFFFFFVIFYYYYYYFFFVTNFSLHHIPFLFLPFLPSFFLFLAFEQGEDPDSRSFFSEIISSVSDIKFIQNGELILSRDYLTLKV